MNRTLVAIFTVVVLYSTSCDRENDNLRLSDTFYNDHRLEFLGSDLTKYSYNPREHFSKVIYDTTFFRVLIFQDSAIKIFGIRQFSKEFKLPIDTLFGTDVLVSKKSNGDLALWSGDKNITVKQSIDKNIFNSNPVDYFLNLKKLIDTYSIVAIKNHPSVNTTEIIFGEQDYLIYKPDTLIFKTENTDFMKYLFQDSKKLDNHWYQFNKEINIDYN